MVNGLIDVSFPPRARSRMVQDIRLTQSHKFEFYKHRKQLQRGSNLPQNSLRPQICETTATFFLSEAKINGDDDDD